jgi:hypothetical protein
MQMSNLANQQAELAKYGVGLPEDSRDPEPELASAERFVHLQYMAADLLKKNERLRSIIAANFEVVTSASSTN